MKHYGAYIVDDTAWGVNALSTQDGPEGSFTRAFRNEWGFPFATKANTDWGRSVLFFFRFSSHRSLTLVFKRDVWKIFRNCTQSTPTLGMRQSFKK